MRQFEAAVFAELSERVVMEAAGRATATAVQRLFPTGRVVGVIGKGSNGRDAMIALRTLQAWRRECCVVLLPGAEVEPDIVHEWDVPRIEKDGVGRDDVLLDGLLGTGASGAPRDSVAQLIQGINLTGARVLAVDGPSGVDLTTGRVEGCAVRASATVTFGALKRGLLLHPGREHAGRILLAEVGFPPVPLGTSGAFLPTARWARENLPIIPPSAHKGTAGIIGVVAGSRGMAGAAVMAAMGALRAGTGGVRVVSHEANRTILQTAVPEAIFHAREEVDVGAVLGALDAILIGPGMGTDEESTQLLRDVLDLQCPTVLDADAVNLLSKGGPEILGSRTAASLLTPHPGELARLLGTSTENVVHDRWQSAMTACERFGCSILAKGTPSLVMTRGEPTIVNSTGVSALATSGMGDTLAGIATAFLGQGADPHIAAGLALFFGGLAASTAGRGRGLLPRDVVEALPSVLLHPARDHLAEPPFLLDLPAAE